MIHYFYFIYLFILLLFFKTKSKWRGAPAMQRPPHLRAGGRGGRCARPWAGAGCWWGWSCWCPGSCGLGWWTWSPSPSSRCTPQTESWQRCVGCPGSELERHRHTHRLKATLPLGAASHSGGRAGWLVTGRLLVWSPGSSEYRGGHEQDTSTWLLLTSGLAPCMVESTVSVGMCAWMGES